MINKFIFDLDSEDSCESGAGHILETARAFEKFYVLSAAVEHEIFDALSEPKTSSELADLRGLHRDMTEKLCRAMTSMALLTKNGDKYALTDLSKRFLIDVSPYYQGDLIKLLKKTREERWGNLSEALKNGPIEISRDYTIFNRSFILAMAEAAICGSLQRTMRALRENEDFMRAKRVLDLGGGHGLYSIAFARLNPNLEVTVFDYPQVIDGITKEMISTYNDEINLIQGDLTKDRIGLGYDVVFVSDVLYRPEASIVPILKKINISLNDGGLLISKHYHLDDISEDQTAVFFDLMFSISGGMDLVHSSGKFCEFIEASGFSVVHVENIGNPSKIIIAKK